MEKPLSSKPRHTSEAPHWLLPLLCGFVAIAVLGIVGWDFAVAGSLIRSSGLDGAVHFLEVITLKSVSEFVLPSILLLSGGVLWMLGRTYHARASLYLGLVPLIAYFASDLSKPLFGRLRPLEALDRGLTDTWFASGNSFPSGHTAFFAGLIVPVVVLHPRTWPLLAIPLVVATQRVLATDHYLSDVSVSFGLALGVAALLKPIVETKSAGGSDRR